MVRDLESWICWGREFQSLGAALKNALSTRQEFCSVGGAETGRGGSKGPGGLLGGEEVSEIWGGGAL